MPHEILTFCGIFGDVVWKNILWVFLPILYLQTRRILNIVYNKLLCIKEEELDEYVHKIVIQTFSKYIGHFQRQSFLSSYFSSKSLFTINTYKLLAFTIFNKFFSINEIEEIYDYCVRRNDLTMKSRHQAIVIIINFIKSSNQTKLETLVKQASPSFTDIVHFIFECKTFSKSYLLSYFEHSRIFMEFLADQNIIRRQEDCCSIAHQVLLWWFNCPIVHKWCFFFEQSIKTTFFFLNIYHKQVTFPGNS